MDKHNGNTSVPALKATSSSEWIREPAAKANLLATTFSSKFVLPAIVTNEYSWVQPPASSDEFVPVRHTEVAKTLTKMDIDSGTGPDGLATRVLKTCSRELGLPLAKLIRRIISEGFWPSTWTTHWLVPLYKRKAVWDPGNYRAINLTTQISKAAERFLSPMFVPDLEQRAFGPSQFAYRKFHGARDAILFYVLSWIGGINSGNKIGIYCSDVAGAFDRVDAQVLMTKLESFGLNRKMLRVIRSWLRNRTGFVIVNSAKSDPISLRNMVFTMH